MLRALIKLTNGAISLVTGLALLLAGAYAGYCLWDNQQVYATAENVQAELLLLKPTAAEETEETDPTFDALQSINPDVCAWIAMDGTGIDHPVLHGASNMDYINTDVYGSFALSGSIFLDFRNDARFADPYSVLYGHHMENGAMFGDLDRYLDRAFFEKCSTGTLLLPDRSYALRVIACVQTCASDDSIFDPEVWRQGVGGLLDYAETASLHCHAAHIRDMRERLDAGAPVQILALTTCSSGFTDARTIVLTEMNEYRWEESGDTQP